MAPVAMEPAPVSAGLVYVGPIARPAQQRPKQIGIV
jgi:hypothetical protein